MVNPTVVPWTDRRCTSISDNINRDNTLEQDKNYGIEYRPDILYKLDEIPPNEYIEKLYGQETYLPPEDVKDEIAINLRKIDFLIDRAEKNIKSHLDQNEVRTTNLNNFDDYDYTEKGLLDTGEILSGSVKDNTLNQDRVDDYIQASKKKYYCREPLTQNEQVLVENFEEGLQGIDGNAAGDSFPRLLAMKRDQEGSLSHVERVIRVEYENLKRFIVNLVEEFDLDEDYLDAIYDSDTKRDTRELVADINSIKETLLRKKETLQDKYDRAVDEGRVEDARMFRSKMRSIDKYLDDTVAKLGYTASQTWALHQKAQSANSFLDKAGYKLLAAPFDNLDGTVCCMIKLIIKQLKLEDDIAVVNEITDVADLKRAVDGLRAFTAMGFNKYRDNLSLLKSKLINLLMAPVNGVIIQLLNSLLDLEASTYDEVEGLLDSILENDIENPDSLLDCFYFETFADFIMDSVDDMFAKIEDRLVDLYKIVNRFTDQLAEDARVSFNVTKTREMYKMLTKLSKALDTVDDFNANTALEEWTESFLMSNGYGTTYNYRSGQFEAIDLGNCLDPYDYNGSHQDFGYEDPSSVPSFPLDENPEYRAFIDKNPSGIDIACENARSPEYTLTDAERTSQEIKEKIDKKRRAVEEKFSEVRPDEA